MNKREVPALLALKACLVWIVKCPGVKEPNTFFEQTRRFSALRQSVISHCQTLYPFGAAATERENASCVGMRLNISFIIIFRKVTSQTFLSLLSSLV
jgi:hypothetical protein